jgi:hypothetical protein
VKAEVAVVVGDRAAAVDEAASEVAVVVGDRAVVEAVEAVAAAGTVTAVIVVAAETAAGNRVYTLDILSCASGELAVASSPLF